MINKRVVLENEHFRLEQLADGIFAAISTLKGGAMSNAGMVDLGNGTLVFDAFLTRAAATELRAAAERLTGRPPTYLVNSHSHGDHVLGNHVFLPEATIVASRGTRGEMAAEDAGEVDRAELERFIGRLEAALAEETDERVRFNYEANLNPRKWLLEELPIALAVPTVVVDGEIEIHGSERVVRLITAGRAHTDGDLYLLCPGDRVAFLGDLGFFQDSPAYIAPSGSAVGWSATLRRFEALDIDLFVPGHGRVGGPEDLSAQCGFLDAAVEAVRGTVGGGGTVNDVIERMRRTEYARWEKTTLYAASLQSVLTQLGEGE